MLKKLGLSFLTSSVLLFTACSSSDDENTKSVSIDFSAKAGNQLISCTDDGTTANTYSLGSTNNSATIADFRFYVSDIYLHTVSGDKEKITLDKNDFQYDAEEGSLALLDFEDNTGTCINRGNTSEMNKSIKGKVKDQEYTKIEFTLGVPFKLNHIEPSAREANSDLKVLNHPSMAWNWQSGMKFTKMEVVPTSNTVSRSNFHLGSTNCVYNNDQTQDKITTCAQPNRVKVILDFNHETQNIVVNFNEILATTDISVDAGGAKGCMSSLADPECGEIFPKLALDTNAQNGLCVNGNDCSTQELFIVENK